MKKIISVCFLIVIINLVAHAQQTVSIKKNLAGKDCDSCSVDGSFAFIDHMAFAILGAPQEYVNRDDSSYKAITRDHKNLAIYFIASAGFTIDFLPLAPAPETNEGSPRRIVDFNDNRTIAPDLS